MDGKKTAFLIILLILAIFPPFILSQYWLHVMIISLFYVMMASSWNLLAGYTGQVSFAHAAFAGVGAYVSGMLVVFLGLSPWVGIFAGGVVAAVLGFGLGFLCIRMGGIYLSLTTLGFSEILRIIITNEDKWTRGTMGLQTPGLLAEYSKTSYYFLFLIFTVLMLILIYKLIHSEWGVTFRAVLNDEVAASSSGIHTIQARILAFTLTSGMAGLAGGLYGHYLMLVTPDIPSLGQMFLVLAMAVIGGMGSFAGPIIGAFVLEILSEYIRSWGEYHVLLFGLIALAMARFAPEGIIGVWANMRGNR
ncbi:MAG: inner-rane translocator [Deltaproteobacteria bacterium]|jgi:branched-chain amino acid transport system permease protein|nr:inner-rane translocator [Deltaproteobacteria bacterium]MBP1717248.1 inner-rane translocator [Deltaproteobacteria bacterium]